MTTALALDFQRRPSNSAVAWRSLVWVALVVETVLQAPDLTPQIVAGVLMGSSAVVVQFADHGSARVRAAAVLFATVAGLGACFASHQGLAEVAVVIAASKLPAAFDGTALRVLVVLDTIAFAATIGYIAQSVAGALAGIGIPLLVQRAIEQRELVTERDRATALLVEAQSGREAEAQAAALRERARIAREMHDVLAHSLAGLSVQLQAVRAVAAREGVGDTVLVPLDKAAALAREGLTEARSTVSALRDPGGLGLDALPALVQRHPGEVTLQTSGPPGSVSGAAGHAVYRAVQESLTNAARYAPGAPVAVHVSWDDGTLAVAVEDTGPAPGRSAVVGQGSGLGLVGMDERIQQVGGTLHAGARPGGGWRVAIEVPAAGHAGDAPNAPNAPDAPDAPAVPAVPDEG